MSDITGRSLPFKMKMHLRQALLPRFAALNRRRKKNSHFIQLQIKNRMLHGLGLKLKAREEELAAERERADKAEKARLVPGEMRCAKCNFGLIRTNLYVNNGTTGPGSNETEPCPNGCGPLWPETWERSAREAWSRLETMHAELAALRADADANKARYTWLADKVLACDYGDNDKGCVGWHIKHCKGPTWIAGDSIDAAIDAAREAQE